MAFTPSAFQVHSLVQDFIPMPYHMRKEDWRVVHNKNYSLPCHRNYRYISQLSLTAGAIVYGILFLWLFFNWNPSSKISIDEMMLSAILFLIICIALPCVYIISLNNSELNEFLNGCLNANLRKPPSLINIPLFGKLDTKVIMTYAYSATYIFPPPMFLVFPLITKLDPFQIAFGSSYATKALSAVTHGLMGVYGSWSILSFMLLLVVCLDSITDLSRRILPTNSRNVDGLMCNFRLHCRRYNEVRILLQVMSNVFSILLAIGVALGTGLATFQGFGTLKLRKYTNIIVYISFPANLFACVCASVVLTQMCGIIYINGSYFRSFWSDNLTSRAYKKQLVSCAPIGISVRPFGVVTARLGFNMCYYIMDNTVNLLLICAI